jgi:hypothetical protein
MRKANGKKFRNRAPRSLAQRQTPLLRSPLAIHPPQINGVELRHSVTLRFIVSTTVVRQSITFQNLLDTLLVATSATTGVDLFQAVRVRRVRIWGLPLAQGVAPGATSSVYLEFAGNITGIVGDQAYHTDTSLALNPAFVDAKPSASSLASDWQVATASTAFLLSVAVGGIVDVHLSFRSQFAPDGNSGAQAALTGATAGLQYIRGLDGLGAATSKFTPELAAAVQ